MKRKMRRKIKTRQTTEELIILLGSSITSLILLFLALFVFKVLKNIKTLIMPGPISIILPYNVDFINLMVLFILTLITPYAVYKYMLFRRKKRVEMLMPILLYDLAGLVRAGHTVPKALEIELEKDLGPLNELLEKALIRITLGDDVSRALSETFKDQTIVTRRFIETIAEAHESGGRAAQVLMEASMHASRLQAFEEERKRNMNVYVSIIYAAILIFLVSSAFLLFFNAALHEAARKGAMGAFITLFLRPDQLKGILYYTTIFITIPSSIAIGKIRSGYAVEGLIHMAILLTIVMVFYTFVDYMVQLMLKTMTF